VSTGLAVLLLSVLAPAGALAQFIYLDCNGDGVNTAADVLNELGTPTTVSIWLDTSRNADSTEAFCPMASEPLTLFSYEVVLHAEGGTVSYGTYTNLQSSMGTALGAASSSTDSYTGFGGTTKLAPGLYQLGTLPVTVESGSPSLILATSTLLGARYATTFGTECPAQEGANTYILGLDWLGMAGCGPPGGGQAALAAVSPARAELRKSAPAYLAAEFVDFNASDSLAVSVGGLPPGLTAVAGTQSDGRRQLRVYGVLDDSVPHDTAYDVTWTGTDGVMRQQAHTTLRALAPEPITAEFEQRVVRLVTAGYYHGLPRLKARAIGAAGLPILARLLRDENYKRNWHAIVAAIGFIGSAAYFDTLRELVWTRFHGEIDRYTLMAIRQAQSSLGPMATVSPQVREYLESTSDPRAWDTLPWGSRDDSRQAVSVMMARETIYSISYTDTEWATALLAQLQQNVGDPALSRAVAYGRWLNSKVRSGGYIDFWAKEDNSPGGYGWREYRRERQ
jgi:hypothetical protein